MPAECKNWRFVWHSSLISVCPARFSQLLEQVYQMLPVLKERSKQLARTMSGGEQQMLAVGRALMADPKMIIFDEP
ncbi:MAG: ATP-binding cassette domain-containing protein, partial [Clostridia bacterium]|nr:ATP-binding cassette domain-containing protein [Clostridia bacterium]